MSSQHQAAAVAAPLVPPGAEPDAVLALRSMIVAGENFRHAVAEHFGFGLSEAVAMSRLASGEPLTPGQLATAIDLTPSSVTALLDRLAAANLAVRRPHPDDRRKVIIVVTDEGQRMLDRVRAWLEAALAGLEDAYRPHAAALLTAVSAGLAEQTEAVRASA